MDCEKFVAGVLAGVIVGFMLSGMVCVMFPEILEHIYRLDWLMIPSVGSPVPC